MKMDVLSLVDLMMMMMMIQLWLNRKEHYTTVVSRLLHTALSERYDRQQQSD